MERPAEAEMKHTLARRLAFARKAKGLSQAQVASRIGITQAAYSTYERETVVPSLITFYEISLVLGVSAAWLLGLPEGEGLGPEI